MAYPPFSFRDILEAWDIDIEFTPRSAIQKEGSTGPSSSNDKFSSKPLEILPSSQEAEVELLNNLDIDSSATSDKTNPPAASAQPSPSKGDVIIIIAGIKANTDIQAATQAQQEQNLSLLVLTDDGSDLVRGAEDG
ncbi:hypothetical protein BU17DRAFT_96334 [Hysterangium stoloniferum]|nr:hypothetical protein BU17DRAFT_96334 [Hysterangium stoloniferum]